MSEPKFTPGPWRAIINHYEPKHYAICNIVNTNGKNICDFEIFGEDDMTEGIANANAIAAAPEMYEMLERILDFKTGGPFISTNPSVQELASLLKKARGEQ